MQNKLMSMSVLMAAMIGVGLAGCSKPAEKTEAAKTETKAAAPAASGDTIKVGILHSLSGTMAISETSLKDTALMTINEINANGGVMGKKLEPVIVDPASDWPLFAEKARQLITQDKVAVIFGCWTSVSRKSVLPVVEELNGLLFYPVQYEGQEQSKNISVHDKFHRALVLSGFFFLKIASTFLNSSFFPKPIKRRIAI